MTHFSKLITWLKETQPIRRSPHAKLQQPRLEKKEMSKMPIRASIVVRTSWSAKTGACQLINLHFQPKEPVALGCPLPLQALVVPTLIRISEPARKPVLFGLAKLSERSTRMCLLRSNSHFRKCKTYLVRRPLMTSHVRLDTKMIALWWTERLYNSRRWALGRASRAKEKAIWISTWKAWSRPIRKLTTIKYASRSVTSSRWYNYKAFRNMSYATGASMAPAWCASSEETSVRQIPS